MTALEEAVVLLALILLMVATLRLSNEVVKLNRRMKLLEDWAKAFDADVEILAKAAEQEARGYD